MSKCCLVSVSISFLLDCFASTTNTLHIALFNLFLAFFVAFFGFIPYWLLLYDTTRHFTVSITSIMGTLMIVFYVLIAWQRETLKLRLILGACWVMCFYFALSAASALLRDPTPMFIGGIICFSQHIGLIAYMFYNQSDFQYYPRTVFKIMIVTTIVVWSASIFLYVEAKNWIVASVVLVFTLLVAVYVRVQLQRFEKHQYRVCREHKELAIINFYTWPLLAMAARCGGNAGEKVGVLIQPNPAIDDIGDIS